MTTAAPLEGVAALSRAAFLGTSAVDARNTATSTAAPTSAALFASGTRSTSARTR